MADVEYNIKFNVDASDAADGFDEVREAANESFQKLLKMFDELNKATEEFNKIDLNALSDDQELLDSAAAMSELANKTREVQGAFAEWQNTISQLDSDADVAIINQMYDSFDSLGHPLANAEDSITAMIEKLKELNHETESFYDDEDGAPLFDEAELQKSLEVIEDGYAEIGASTMNVIAAEERQRAAFQAAYEEYAKAQEKEEAAAEALAKRAQKETAAKEAKEQAEAAKAAAKHQEEVKKKIEATINSAKKLANTMKSVGSAILSAAKQAGKLALSLAKGPSLGSGMLKKALGVAGIVGIGALFKQASSAANDLTDSVGMVNAAFGENSKSMHDWADNQAIYYNVSRLSAEKYFGELGEYLKNANVDADAAATMAKNMVAKAGEVGRAYAGMSSDQAMNIMQNVLAGGRVKQQGSKIGLKLDDDAYQAELLAEGINAVYKDLSASEQMIIRYNTVMRQLGDTTGSTADGFMSWEGAVANLSANVKDALSSFGLIIQHYLLPVVQLLNTVMAAVADALRGLLGTLGIDLPQASTAAASAIEGVGDAATDAGKDASTGLAGFDKLNNLSESKGGGAGGLDSKAVSGTIKPLDQLTDKMGEAKTKLQELLDKIKNLDYHQLGKKIAQLFNYGVEKIKTWLKKLGDFDLGTKLADLFNGFIEDFDTKSLGDLLGTAFGNMQDTITNFLKRFKAENFGKKLADLLIGFDLPKNLGKLGTNVGLFITSIGKTINGMLGGTKGDEVRKNIKEGIKNLFSNAINNISPQELGQAIGNLAKTIGSALTGAAEGIDGLGKKLADTVNEAIKTGGVSDLAKGFADFILAAAGEIGSFITSTDWLSLVGEIFGGIKDAIVNNPEGAGALAATLGGVLAAKFAWSSLSSKASGLVSSLFGAGKGVGDGIAGGINSTTASGGTIALAVAGAIALIGTAIKEWTRLKNATKELNNAYASFDTAKSDYAGQVKELNASSVEEMKQIQQSIDSKISGELNDLASQLGTLDQYDSKRAEVLQKYATIASEVKEKYEALGIDMSNIDSEIEKLKGADESAFSAVWGSEASREELYASLGNIATAIQTADKDLDESVRAYDTGAQTLQTAASEANTAISESVGGMSESIGGMSEEVDGLSTEVGDLTGEVLALVDVDLPEFKKNIDELNTPMKLLIDYCSTLNSESFVNLKTSLSELETPLQTFNDKLVEITQVKWDGQLVDHQSLQSNLDIALNKVKTCVSDIQTAISEATALKNFTAVLEDNKTIKVDSSGKIGVSVDAKAHIDSSELNSWYSEFTMKNKNSRG